MLTENTALLLIFGVTSLVAFLGMAFLGRSNDEEVVSEAPSRPLFGFANGAIAGMLPSTDSGRDSVQKELWLAGYPQPSALNNFLCIRNLFCIVPLVMGLISALTANVPRTGLTFAAIGLVMSILGFSLPRVILSLMAASRKSRLQQSMPVLMDTLALSLSSGVSLNEGLKRSGEAIQRGHRDLSQEVRTVNKHAQLRSLDDALQGWKKRIPIPEISSLVFLLTSSNRQGVDVTQSLHELSTSYRTNARQQAESAANRANFWLIFPTVLCLLAAAGLMLVGPPLVEAESRSGELKDAFDRMSGLKNEIRQDFPKAAPQPPPAPGTLPPQL